jgi:hypothetical protein
MPFDLISRVNPEKGFVVYRKYIYLFIRKELINGQLKEEKSPL